MVTNALNNSRNVNSKNSNTQIRLPL